jgi:hypothetical protein
MKSAAFLVWRYSCVSLPVFRATGKLQFLSGYRWQITPENSLTRPLATGAGYNTEKIAHAHMAGAIPIYWGDSPVDPEVFNPSRILYFSPKGRPEDALSDVAALAKVLDTVIALETDPAARQRWFQEPVLARTADAWLKGWCSGAAARFAAALKRARERRRLPAPLQL